MITETPINKRIHAPPEVNGCTKYEHNPLNIVSCRVVTKEAWTDARTDGQSAQNTTISYGPNGLKLSKFFNFKF